MSRDLSQLSVVGRIVYDRLTMEDADREPGDGMRKVSYDPCCAEHGPNGAVCVLAYGHTSGRTELNRLEFENYVGFRVLDTEWEWILERNRHSSFRGNRL